MRPKLHIRTMGCQMNEYDSARMLDTLKAAHGMEKTEDPAAADLILLNTCSIREKAQEKVFSQLGRWRPFKDDNPALVIGVGGCVASQEGAAILERAPFVDIVFGPQTLHRLPEMYADVIKRRRAVVDISFPKIEKFDNLPPPRAEGATAFVSVMEGCNKYCSFCVVPYTRGREISRPFDSVIAEVVALAAQGVKEVNLLGQNVNAYRSKLPDGRVIDLAALIEHVAAVDGIRRIRYTTSHPVEFSKRLIEVYARVPELVSHLHLPVQSGSDRILALMRRRHTRLQYKNKIKRLRAIRPDLSLSSDFIIGFPGETERDFTDTLKLIDEVGFDHSFSFVYSQRPGTPAASLPDDTPPAVKKRRLALLQARLGQQAAAISAAMVGSVQSVLVEGRSKKNPAELRGRTENNRIVNFKGPQTLSGQFVNIEITAALPNSLRGNLPRTVPPDAAGRSAPTAAIYHY